MSAKIGTGRVAGVTPARDERARSLAASGEYTATHGRLRRRAVFLACTALVAAPLPAWAATYNVSDAASLQAAIASVNAGGGTDTINITGNITLTSELPAIAQGVTISGNGNTVSGNNQYRVFFIAAPSGAAVNISNVTLADGYAKGGNGGGGGGGGMGAGGAIFAMSGAITLTDVGFSNNRAQGGNGGTGATGGGGGLGGNGSGPGGFLSGGGGGIGLGATGGTNSTAGGAGILPGAGGGSASSTGGGANGGGGGGSSAGSGGGGGGVGGGNSGGSAGGAGGFGGGGGGSGSNAAGNGGFGGGGGGGYQGSMTGGWGGFGGGGGSGVNGAGGGGYGGGGGASSGIGGGGGGMGAGGAVFVCTTTINASCGATLTISNTANKTVDGAVIAGTSDGIGGAGTAQGGAFFLTNGAVGNISVASGTTTTVSSSIVGTGDGGLALTGGGTLALTSTQNSFNGVSVSGTGSTLSIAAPGSVTGTIKLADRTGLQFAGGGSYANLVTVTGTTSLDTGGIGNTVTYSGQITDGTGPGAIDIVGGGTLILTNTTNSYSGGTSVKGNTTLSISDQNALGSGGLTLGDATSYGRLVMTGVTTFVSRNITLGQGGGEIAPASGTLLNLMGVISGSGALRMNGPGHLVLSSDDNTYSGGTEVTGGVLEVTVNNALGTGALTLGDQAVFALQNNLNIANALKLRGTAGLRVSSGDTDTYSGVISDETGPAGIKVNGGGKLILTGANTYSGQTQIVVGSTLQIGNGGTSGVLPGDVNNAGTLIFNRSDDLSYGGVISGTGALAKSGAGILTLTGANSYTGATSINAGTLKLDLGGRLGSGAVEIGSASAILDLNGQNQTVAGLNGTGEVKLGSGVLTINQGPGTSSFGGVISGLGSLTKQGIGSLILTGANTYSGVTTILGGGLQIGYGSTTGSIQGDIVNNGSLAFSRTDDYTFAGSISGSGSVTNVGATLILTGNNTYTGGTAVNFGALQIGDGTTDGTIAGDITVGTNVTFNTIGTRSFTGRVLNGASANGSLTKTGAGTLTLTGVSANSGDTSILGGTLRLGDGGRVSGTSLVAVASGATFDLDGHSQQLGALTGAGTVQLGSGGALDIASWTGTFGGVIAGAGSLSLSGATYLTLTGDNTFASAVINTGSRLTIGAGGGSGSLTGNVSIGEFGRLTFNRNGSLTYAGDVSGAGALTKSGAGKLILTGTSSYTGGTTITTGTLQIGNGGTAGTIGGDITNNGVLSFNRSDSITYGGVIVSSGSLTQAGSATLTLTGANAYTGGTTINAGGTLRLGNDGTDDGSITGDVVNNGTLEFDNLNDASFAGVISGSGGLTKLGANTLTLTGASTYAGLTTISAGPLRLGGNNRLGGGDLSMSSGTIFDLAGFAQRVGALGGAGEVKLGSGGALTVSPASDATFSGVISGSGSLTKTGSGRQILVGENSFIGSTTISAGTLQLGNSGTTGSLASDIVNNGTLAFNRSNEYVFGGVISGSGTVEQNGAGRTILTGANTYGGGTSINAGALQIGNGGAAGSIAGSVTVASGAEFAVNRSDEYTLPAAVTGAGTFAHRGNGKTILGDGMSYTGGTVIAAGTLQVGSGGATGSLGSGDIANDGVFVVNKSNGFTIAGVISGTGSFETTGGTGGTGVTTLSGANTYTGATTVSGGTLEVSGSLGNTAVTVNSGATLIGAGTIAGAVTIADGAHLAPGAAGAAGVLGVGSLNLYSGSILDFDLGLPNQSTGSDRVDVTGSLVLDGTLNVANAGSFGGGIYRLFGYGGTLTDNGLALGTLPGGVSAAELSVQTSVASQVNLVNSAGLTLNFWDGSAAGSANNNLVDGGAGTWSASSGSWTDQNGSLNAPPSATPGFMIFQTLGGTVTVDNTAGAVSATGMQFAVDGYRIEGGAITLSGAQATIRVGDGTSAGAGYTATIASVLTGTSDLVKTDLGTLVLSGANTYTGNTLLNSGTLSVSSDANLGDAGGSLVFNGGVLRVTGTSFTSTARSITFDNGGGGFDIADAANSFTVGQALGGTGGLGKLGAGTLVLTGSNSYSGGTTIAAGTLQLGDGGTSGSVTGDVANSDTLAFNRSDAVTFAGAISGNGAVRQIGTGRTTLTGTNTYTGGTVITAGTLQVGDGGTAGSITGDVVNDGALAFNRSDAVTFAGAVSGSGSLRQIGSGTLTLTGANSYSGGTVVAAGTLQIGDGATSGSITGDVVNDGALAFNRSDAVTFGGVVSGNGALRQIASGTLTLTGTNTYSGGTAIAASGVVQLGDGGTSGSITGDVVNDGVLAFNRSDVVSFAGAISGSGAAEQRGAGTTILTGSNSYTGGTVIAAGTLQIGNGGTSGSLAGDVANSGTLAFSRSNASTFSGVVSGTGELRQIGSGTTILTGANSYTGGTTISAGTLQIGAGGTSGSILGDVANSGTLAFNRSDAVGFTGTISGSGKVAQLGAGTLTLAGVNTYSGGTVISAGTLIGSAPSFGSGAILNDAALVIDQPGNASFANAIDGSGSFTKAGSGNLKLTGISGLTGPTTVAAGRLSINGSLASSAVTVLSGAELGGNGTVGSTTILAGGTIAPGNSIGTLTVNGDLVLAPGSTYAVEVGGNGTSDRIIVSGSATVTGSNVTITALDPQTSYQQGQRYTLLTVAGGTVGNFAGVTTSSAFLDLALDPKTGEVGLNVQVKADNPGTPSGPGTPPGASPPAVFQTVAQTQNQYATALGLNSLPQVGGTLALYNSLLMLDAASARGAFDLLSGEVHASAKTALVEESSIVRSAAIDRLRSAFGAVGSAPMATMNYGFTADLAPAIKGSMPRLSTERFAVWGQGYGAWGRTDGDRNAQKLTRSTGGFLIGADVAAFDTMRFGVVAGYSRTEFDVKGRRSSGESDNYHIGLYGGGQWGALGLRAGASYTWHDVETSRIATFAGFGNSLKSDYNAGTAQVFGELGYRIDLGRVALEPFAGLAYVNLHSDGFAETGGIAALTGRSDDTSIGYSTLGLRASTTFALQGMDLTLRGTLAWRHAFGDVDPTATLAFAGANPFTVSGLPITRDAALVEAGLDFAISPTATLGLSYTGQLANDAQDHAFKGNFAVKF